MLFRMTAEAEGRRLMIIGIAVVLALSAIIFLVAANLFARKPTDRVSILMDVPLVGQGVAPGTALLCTGLRSVRLPRCRSSRRQRAPDADLDYAPIADLTDTFGVDFRPANYFVPTVTQASSRRALRSTASVAATCGALASGYRR